MSALLESMRAIDKMHIQVLKFSEDFKYKKASEIVLRRISTQRKFVTELNSLAASMQYKKAYLHVTSLIRQNLDYDEGWAQLLDKFRAEMKGELLEDLRHKKSELQDDWVFLNSFCKSKKNLDYWKKLRDKNKGKSEAVEDFIRYISSINC